MRYCRGAPCRAGASSAEPGRRRASGGAQDSGDNALAAAGLLWELHWTALLVPKNDSNSFMELRLHPIPAPWKAEILILGLAATVACQITSSWRG